MKSLEGKVATACNNGNSAKGGKDRETLLPETLVTPLKSHLEKIKIIYDKDRLTNVHGDCMPDALDCKYPSASRQWYWFWVFPLRTPYQ